MRAFAPHLPTEANQQVSKCALSLASYSSRQLRPPGPTRGVPHPAQHVATAATLTACVAVGFRPELPAAACDNAFKAYTHTASAGADGVLTAGSTSCSQHGPSSGGSSYANKQFNAAVAGEDADNASLSPASSVTSSTLPQLLRPSGVQPQAQHAAQVQQQQQQWQPQGPDSPWGYVVVADADKECQKNISRSLRQANCSSLSQLSAIVSEHGANMDGQSVAASFTAAARLVKQPAHAAVDVDGISQQLQQHVQQLLQGQLLPLLRLRLRQLDATGLQMVLYSLAVLQYKDEALLLLLEQAITPMVRNLSPGRVCQLLWALGQLRLSPQARLLQQLLHCTGVSMPLLQGGDLCQVLQGLVQLQVQPSQAWLDGCCARVLQLCAHHQLGPRALSSILHSLARLVVLAQTQQQQQQQQRHSQQGQQQQHQQHAGGPAALPPHLLQQLLAATQAVLLNTATASLQEHPEQQGVQQEPLPVQQLHQYEVGDPRTLLAWPPAQQRAVQLVPVSEPAAQRRLAQQQVQVAWQHQAPTQHQLVRAVQASVLQQAEWHGPHDACHTQEQRQQVQPRCTRCSAETVQQQQLEPLPALPQQPFKQHQQQEQQRQQQQQQKPEQLTLAGLNTLADALRLLRIDPPPDWQAAYAAAALQLMQAPDPRNVPLLLAPLVRWRHGISQAWLQQYLHACASLLTRMNAQGLAVLGHSVAACQACPPPQWLAAYLAAAGSTSLARTPAGSSFLMHTLGSWRQQGALQPRLHGFAAAEGARPDAGTVAAGASSSAALGNTAAATAAAGVPQSAVSSYAAGQGAGTWPRAGADGDSLQLESAAAALAGQCLRCLRDDGERFTPEQLGMLCKGLALWGSRGTPQLAGGIEEVLLHHLSHQRSSGEVPRQRLTAATLCSILLVLAVVCPAAATPALMARFWAAWSSWLLGSTTAAHAASVAWATSRLQITPPQEFVQGLLQQLLATAAEAQLQHLAAVLVEARRGEWPVEQQAVVLLLGQMLQQQAREHAAAVAAQAAGDAGAGVAVVAARPCRLQQDAVEAGTAWICSSNRHPATVFQTSPSGGCCQCSGHSSDMGSDAGRADTCSGSSKASSTCGSSSSRGSQAARLFGLANHLLKGWHSAAAAAAAWCDVMPPHQLEAAALLYRACAAVLPPEQQRPLQRQVQVLMDCCGVRGISTA